MRVAGHGGAVLVGALDGGERAAERRGMIPAREESRQPMSDYFRAIAAAASSAPTSATKADLFAGRAAVRRAQLLRARPGAAGAHARRRGQFYLVVSGRARMTVGDETREAGPGTVVWAPADVPHGVAEALERTVLLVGIAPPPALAAGAPASRRCGRPAPRRESRRCRWCRTARRAAASLRPVPRSPAAPPRNPSSTAPAPDGVGSTSWL